MKIIRSITALLALLGIVWGVVVITGLPWMATTADRRGYSAVSDIEAMMDSNPSQDPLAIPRDVLKNAAWFGIAQTQEVQHLWAQTLLSSLGIIGFSCLSLLSLLATRQRNSSPTSASRLSAARGPPQPEA